MIAKCKCMQPGCDNIFYCALDCYITNKIVPRDKIQNCVCPECNKKTGNRYCLKKYWTKKEAILAALVR